MIPDELMQMDQWVCWRTECRDCGARLEPTTKLCPECGEKATKKPIDPNKSGLASSTDPDTWATYSLAVSTSENNGGVDGIGFVFSENDTITGVDLDDCRDPDNGELHEWAETIVDELDSYTEISPSGTGIHIYAHGIKPEGRNRSAVSTGEIEMYESGRFFTITGNRLEDRPLEVKRRSKAIKEIHQKYVADNETESQPDEQTELDVKPDGKTEFEADATDITLSGARERDDKLDSLLTDIEPAYSLPNDDDSPSGYDFATASKLYFWGFSKRQIAQILRTYRYRDKLNRDDYLKTTINNACSGERYSPSADNNDTKESGWSKVKALFQSDEPGSTTRGYEVAADLLTQNESFAANRATEELYYYKEEEGFYVRKGRSYIEELLVERIPGYVNSGRVKNVFELVRAKNYVDNKEFNPPKNKLCVTNGVLDLETNELEPHTPDYYFTAKFDAPYDPEASAGNWVNLLQHSTTSRGEMQKIEEFVGYMLESWHHKREKNLFIVGPPQSGKSTVSDAIENMVGGMPSVSGLSPHQIANNQFDASALKDAMLNKRNDINGGTIDDSGTLKTVFSGETLKLERKFKEAEFEGPNAKHLYTANWLPAISGQDDSFYRRVLIVEFPNQVPDDDRDVHLEDKLQDEAAGILNRALNARERLNEQGHFTNDRDRTDTRHLWDSWRDSNKRFLHTQFDITADMSDKVEKEFYMRAYREFAAKKGYELKSQRAVTQSFQWVPEIWVQDDHYAGIKLRDEDAADSPDSRSQWSEIEKIRAAIATHSDDGSGADQKDVVAALEDTVGREKAITRIEKLKRQGEVMEPANGKLRLTRE